MILRVYAMWNQSRRILYILLLVYVPQVIVSFTLTGIYDNPNTYLTGMFLEFRSSSQSDTLLLLSSPVTAPQVLNLSICLASQYNAPQLIYLYDGIPRLTLSAMLLILAGGQTIKQSVDMYKATKQWQPNRYMQQLTQDGILYFFMYVFRLFPVFIHYHHVYPFISNFCTKLIIGFHWISRNLFYNIYAILENTSILSLYSTLFLAMLSFIFTTTTFPRFIIGVRELYDHDTRRGQLGIDSGFGVLSQLVDNAVASVIAFAEVSPGQGQAIDGDESDLEMIQLGEDPARQVEVEMVGDLEVIRLEVRGDGSQHV